MAPGTISSPYFIVGTRHEVLATIRSLDPSGFCTTRLQAFYDKDPDYSLPMGDLVALSMPMVHLKGTTRTQIPAPGANMLGFTQSGLGRFAFRQVLNPIIRATGTEIKPGSFFKHARNFMPTS